jgi:hypothetical protein
MKPVEAAAFDEAFTEKKELNALKVTSGRLNYLPPGFNRRMLHFLCSSHLLLSPKIAVERLKKARLDRLFVLVPGELLYRGKKAVLYPVTVTETLFINSQYPAKEMALKGLEERIYLLSNGELAVKEVLERLRGQAKTPAKREALHKRCIDFYIELFARGMGLAFERSWKREGDDFTP